MPPLRVCTAFRSAVLSAQHAWPPNSSPCIPASPITLLLLAVQWAGGPRCPLGRARAEAVLELLIDAGYRPTVWRGIRVPDMYGVPPELVGQQVDTFDPFDHYAECFSQR